MRALLCFCLATGLLAGEPPRPGLEPAFLARVLAESADATRPWKTFRMPVDGPSAVVEVVGELTPEELRQVTFQEFLAWFQADLRHFLHVHGGDAPAPSLAAATLPVDRFGGNPVPKNVPLGRANF
jgi:hypothetical protein